MRISRASIDRIYQAIDIVEVIGEFVSLKKSGSSYKALSPFTTEKSPSFYVVPSKQIFKCFSTGKGGDAITFLMESERLTYVEALKYLAQKYQIELVYDQVEGPQDDVLQTERDGLYVVLQFAKNFYQDLLLHDEEGMSIGLSYFKERGLSEETIKAFDLGYSKKDWTLLYQSALKLQYTEDALIKSGLIRKKEDGKVSDFFRDRVMFTIHSVAGKVIALAGRTLSKEKGIPKYINSPETEVYKKSQVLYGMFQAKNGIRQQDVCYLVEGYMDVISLYQHGIKNVVASSGTSLTEEQIKLIGRYTKNITILYDGDIAGIKAALRGIDMLLEQSLAVKVVLFPDGDDPDSYVQKVGGEAFQVYLKKHTKDFISFKTEILLKDAGDDPFQKAQVIRDVVTSIAKVQDAIQRAVYFKRCSQLLDIDEGVIITEYNKMVLQKRKDAQKGGPDLESHPLPSSEEGLEEAAIPTFEKADPHVVQEKEVIRLLFSYADKDVDEELKFAPFLLNQIEDVQFKDSKLAAILSIFKEELAKGHVIGPEYFLELEQPHALQTLEDILNDRHELSPLWNSKFGILIPAKDEQMQSAAEMTIMRLKWRTIQQLIRENLQAMHLISVDAHDELDDKLIMHTVLKENETSLAKKLGIVISG